MPAGGLFSTAADMEKFCRMILDGGTLDGKQYLSPEAISWMTARETTALATPITALAGYFGQQLRPRRCLQKRDRH